LSIAGFGASLSDLCVSNGEELYWLNLKESKMTQKNINPLHKIYGTLKSTASKAAGKIAGNASELTMRFYKEDFLWYADVNGWPGPKNMLLMVDGADAFLDYLSGNGEEVTLDLSLDPKAGYEVLNYIHPHPAGDGAYYMADMNDRQHKLWLCGVTEFVFGYMPEEVWYKK